MKIEINVMGFVKLAFMIIVMVLLFKIRAIMNDTRAIENEQLDAQWEMADTLKASNCFFFNEEQEAVDACNANNED